ncbi:MAG: transcription termination factor Rho [Clostridia bacterium]|nr:transcription termination factor Rho [Clostridia bacterium]
MDYQSLYVKTVVELRKMAKEMGVKLPAGASKAIIINLLLDAFRDNAAQPVNENISPKTEKQEAAEAAEKEPEDVPENNAAQEAQNGAKAPEDRGSRTEETTPQPRMRIAANPQVVNRRMPFRQNADREMNASHEAGNTAFQPRQRSGQSGENPGRYAVQQDTRSTGFRQEIQRYDRRPESQPARMPMRQESYSVQNRPDRRNESMPLQGRFNPRSDRIDSREKTPFEPQNRYVRPESGVDGRNRCFRPESTDGRNTYWREEQPQEMRGGMPRRNDEADWNASAQADTEGAYSRFDGGRPRYENYYNEEYKTSNPAVPEMLASGECTEGSGILEIQADGYGFLRAENYQQGSRDVYVSIAQIRRFNLRMGDYVVGQTRPQREGDRYTAMMYITEVNGKAPEQMIGRKRFDELVPVYPDERLRLELPGENDLSLRMIDMLAPIGKGQRGLIVSQPKAGKTTLLKKLANAITVSHPEIKLIVLLIDERPEEVTDMKRSIKGEVVYSTFDETPESHTQVSEMVLERAQRLVELGEDVVILMDSITRLARAYNLVIPPTGRSLSGGLDPGALHKPKRFFGAARNIENGGSLTVIATALIDTGSRMDDIIYEEFKGTGNMELHLDRKLSDKRIFPAVDMVRSGTRREELLLTETELEGMYRVRRMLSGDQNDVEKIIGLIEKTSGNGEFFQRLNAYQSVYEKSGFSMGKDGSR